MQSAQDHVDATNDSRIRVNTPKRNRNTASRKVRTSPANDLARTNARLAASRAHRSPQPLLPPFHLHHDSYPSPFFAAGLHAKKTDLSRVLRQWQSLCHLWLP